jgi:hypothetical protein
VCPTPTTATLGSTAAIVPSEPRIPLAGAGDSELFELPSELGLLVELATLLAEEHQHAARPRDGEPDPMLNNPPISRIPSVITT